MKPKRIYLDFAASTPADPAVVKAMAPYWNEEYGNPGSLHSFGQAGMGAIDKAQQAIAKAIKADFREIIFTGSATQSNELAIRGAVKASRLAKPKIIVCSIEHDSVLEAAREMKESGAEVIYIPVNEKGIVDVEKIKEELDKRTAIVSVMYVNNEIGSVEPIAEIAGITKSYKLKTKSSFPLFHTDAAQAFEYFDCDTEKLGVDLMTLSGQKIYGPKGISALYVRKLEDYKKQEFLFHSGTKNTPLIAGFGKAVELAVKERAKNFKNVMALKNQFWRGLKSFYPQAEMNGDSRAPHILNVYFPTEYAGDLLIKLDMTGIAASAGSACSARSYMPSPVLQALGLSQERVRGSLRFSFGKTLKSDDIKTALKQIEEVIR